MADVRFIRKNGKIIPIGAARVASVGARAAGAGAAALAAHSASKEKAKHITVNHKLDLTGLGLSVASGAVAAATFSTPAGFVGGHLAAHAIDAAGIGANIGSVAGRGHAKERAQQGAKQEFRNLLVGNAIYGAGVLGVKKNRDALIGATQKILALARKGLRVV